MRYKEKLREGKLTSAVYAKLKKKKDSHKKRLRIKLNGSFDNRSKGSELLCVVLAGYKPFLYDVFFERLQSVLIDELDVCLVSSGLYSKELSQKCREQQWSYLCTKQNNVSLIQNIAIHFHPNAKLIFKIDEDILLTKGYFNNMLLALMHSKVGRYKAGIVAPIIPVNGYGYTRILDKLHLWNEYESKFGKAYIEASKDKLNKVPIENDARIARFFWGEGGVIPKIDVLNDLFSKDDTVEYPCPIRFSIGAILFERQLWEDMGYFDVDLSDGSMGRDEVQICTYCMRYSRPIMVSENIVVGHFSFGPQTDEMRHYFFDNQDMFRM